MDYYCDDDSTCGGTAINEGGSCGSGMVCVSGVCTASGAGDCCTVHSTPGCSVPSISSCVCSYDSYCCSSQWDSLCVSEVESYGCGSCGGGSCTYPSGWYFAAGLDGWSVTGNWAWETYYYELYFYWSPTVTSYDYATTSPSFSLSGCSAATLGYTLELNDYYESPDTYEYLYVECNGGSGWVTLATFADGYNMSGSFGPTNYTAALPGSCLSATTQIRFRAAGANSFNINDWYVDNVTVY
jgi:hypothetical protein